MPRIRASSIPEHKALTRRQILDATRDLIRESGTADLDLAELAAIAGIGRTTLYEYFRDRDDLIASLVEEELPAVIGQLTSQTTPGGSPDERLLRLAELTVEFVATDPVLGLILHREVPRLGTNAQDRIRMAHTDLSASLVGLYVEAVKAGTYRPVAADIAGRLIHDVTMSAARSAIAAPERLQEVTANLRQFLHQGFAAQPGSR
ncbi:MAG: TetR/AcrR family transcriptional regulator [Acidimicrobiia bacterium]